MYFTINESNKDLLTHLTNLDKSEYNNFINNILNLGFKEFKKQNIDINTDNIIINNFNSEFEKIKLLINEIKLETQNNSLILNKNNNKGNVGENIIYEFFNKNNYQIEDTSEIAHSGDLKLYVPEINQNVLIEIKNYKNTVDQKQIDKFYYDIEHTGIKLGIFISLQSKIVNIKYPIEWKITKDNKIFIFISECKEEYLYIAIFCLINLYKNNTVFNNYNIVENTELLNDIKYLSLQQENINKLKNEILNIHSSYSNSILSLYNNICIFDNNFNYIINKIYNKLDDYLCKKIGAYNKDIYIKLDEIQTNNKELLEIIISDLNNNYNLELIDNKKIKIFKNTLAIGEIKILKTTINLILDSGLELKNINKDNWTKIIKLI